MTEKNVAIMFPNNSVALMIGQIVMSDMANIGLFIPADSVHEQAAGTTLHDLGVASAVLGDVTVKRLRDFTDLATFEIVVFPCLDMHPRKSRYEYSNMCHNLFRYVIIFDTILTRFLIMGVVVIKVK